MRLTIAIAVTLLVGIAIGLALGGRKGSVAETQAPFESQSGLKVTPDVPAKKTVATTTLPAPRPANQAERAKPVVPRSNAPAPQAVPVPPPPGSFAGDSVFVPPGFNPRRPPPPPWIPAEKKLNRLSSDREIEDFNKSVRAKNIAPYVVGAFPYVPQDPSSQAGTSSSSASEPAPKSPSLEKILGNYEGEIRLDEGKKVWQMTLELSGKIEDHKLKGKSVVEISDAGTVISKMTQTGELSLLKKLADESVGILLVPADGQYFQLYHVKERDFLTGNYYVKEGPTEYVPKGTVRLTRKATPRG